MYTPLGEFALVRAGTNNLHSCGVLDSLIRIRVCVYVCVGMCACYLLAQMVYFELGRRQKKSNTKTNKQVYAEFFFYC